MSALRSVVDDERTLATLSKTVIFHRIEAAYRLIYGLAAREGGGGDHDLASYLARRTEPRPAPAN